MGQNIRQMYSTKTYNKTPIRTLVFKKDSTYIETVCGTLGCISAIFKYYFINDGSIVLVGTKTEKSKPIFSGNNKLKFLSSQKDSAQDLMYKLTFKRDE